MVLGRTLTPRYQQDPEEGEMGGGGGGGGEGEEEEKASESFRNGRREPPKGEQMWEGKRQK